MEKPYIADTRPAPVELEAGKTYYWCVCGRSKDQPFCDGSHAGTGFEPLAYTPEKSGKQFLCQCKRTNKPPFCDGTHKEVTQDDLDEQAGLRTAWYKVAERDELRDGDVRAVQAGSRTIALTCLSGKYAALDNACPHQGGPLAEGSIERGADDQCWLRCPWHGWDFDPLTGRSPGGHDDAVTTYPVELRDDGIYVAVRERTVRQRTLSDLMTETMVNWGVTQVFGMVGHSNLGLADAIRHQAEQGRMNYIGIRHEGAAAFAASGYAKLSGRPAACLTIAGPGATNLLTGLWDAKVDRAPVLALTGQVQTQVLGPGAFQEIDLASAFAPVAAFSQTVYRDSRHAELMNLACKNAIVRRDVAHLIFPDEMQTLPAGDEAEPGGPEGRVTDQRIHPDPRALESALERLAAAERPAIIVGYGARYAMDEIVGLAERLDAPLITTFKAKGQVADDHPLATGVLGRSGTPVASWFMNEADLLLVFGASFADHTGIAPDKPIIQVDFEPMALGKFHAVELPLWGEIGVTAAALRSRSAGRAAELRAEVAERRQLWQQEKARRRARNRNRGLNSALVFEALGRLAPEDAVLAVDVGNNTYSFGRYFECRRQRVLMSGYLGSIGFAFPAAMGAWAATQSVDELRGRKVIAVAGDGGFGQYLAEFTTAVRHGMQITLVLLNNSALGKISKEQRAGQWPVWETGLTNPDFARFAQLCGGEGWRVAEAGGLDAALAAGLQAPGPALVEILTDPELV